MKIVSKDEFKRRKKQMKEESKPHLPGTQTQRDKYTRKVVSPDEVKKPQKGTQEEYEKETKAARALLLEAEIMQFKILCLSIQKAGIK